MAVTVAAAAIAAASLRLRFIPWDPLCSVAGTLIARAADIYPVMTMGYVQKKPCHPVSGCKSSYRQAQGGSPMHTAATDGDGQASPLQ
ncbi:hypothetical protein GCM10010508_46440 [Streptomyces naganishii JCM 4654]|uniref:Uncharacterized protein n=1 Tax=Streptomyces naganishii JCM 4654 TaxID=1306179 RepID=A0A918Y6N2_9ACTN|nr:hypothetical protein GCM10010508_46440 [Streptomyces naganishii JCM 4654]